MAWSLIWAPSARLDLRDLAAYIAESRPVAAGQFVRHMFRLVGQLAEFPESGRVVPEFGDPSIREVIHRPCRVVYRVKLHEQTLKS